jgi:hypothetical protein
MSGRKARLAASHGWAWIVAASIALLASTSALAQSTGVAAIGSDIFKTSYFDVGTSVFASKAGYGGPGESGGAGDNTVRIINPTAANGTLCAMIYVFDDAEELQTCCGCPVTADGLRTLSIINDLTFDFGVNSGDLNNGIVEIVSATPNFADSAPSPGRIPGGTNGVCSPTGLFSTDPFHRAAPIIPITGLRAWMTHDESIEPGNIKAGQTVHGVSVEEFGDSPLESTHLSQLQKICSFLITGGSGAGICTCGVGDSVVARSAAR